MYMLPKFHCELNHIERVWALEKLLEHNSRFGHSRKYAEHFRMVRHYTFAYLDVPGGSDLEKLVRRQSSLKTTRRQTSLTEESLRFSKSVPNVDFSTSSFYTHHL